MPYLKKRRKRFGDATTDAIGVAAVPFTNPLAAIPALYDTTSAIENSDPLGDLGTAETDIGNFLYSAVSGNIDQNQQNAIKSQVDANIATAAAGNTDLQNSETQQANNELNSVFTSGYYGGSGNVLNDLGLDPNAPPGAPPSGPLGWIEANALLIFAAVAAFLIFRPDKALRR